MSTPIDTHQTSNEVAVTRPRLLYGLNDKPPFKDALFVGIAARSLVHQHPELLQRLRGFSPVRLRIVYCPAPL